MSVGAPPASRFPPFLLPLLIPLPPLLLPSLLSLPSLPSLDEYWRRFV
jgi:hypothetical protein